MKFKNKKATGELLPAEIIRVVLGVLVLVVLIILAVALSGILVRSTKLEQAKATLNEIIAKSEQLKEVGDFRKILISNPRGWIILSRENQLCFCPDVGSIDNPMKKCISDGICKNIGIRVEGSCSSFFGHSLRECIEIKKSPFELYLIKLYEDYYLSSPPVIPKGRFLSEDNITELLQIVDREFHTLIKKHVENPSNETRQAIISKINNAPVIKDAFTKGYLWKMRLQTGTSNNFQETIYSYEISREGPLCLDLESIILPPEIQTNKGSVTVGIFLCKKWEQKKQ